jgi:CBS domain-containing protein
MKARDIMTRQVEAVTPDEPLTHAARIMADHDVGIVPVIESRGHPRLLGVITDRDLTVRHTAHCPNPAEECPVAAHMTRDTWTVGEDADAHGAIEQMRAHHVRRIPVVGPDHELAGVISVADVVLRMDPQPTEVKSLLIAESSPAVAHV